MRTALITEDIHKLVKIKKDENWCQYGWRISHDTEKDMYWVPIEDELREPPPTRSSDDCYHCKRRWRSKWMAKMQ